MAEEDVEVRFGANIHGVTEGAAAIKESVDHLRETFLHLAEAVGIAFTVDAIKEFISSMAELGEVTVRLADSVGITTEQVGELNALAMASGGSAQELARTMSLLALNFQKAEKASTPTAEALHALGLNAQDLIGLPLPEVLDKLSQHFDQFANGMNKAAIANALVRGGAISLLPALQALSRDGEELREMAERTGTALSSQTAHGMEETHNKLEELGLAMQGLGIKVFVMMKGVIDDVTSALTSMIESISPQTIHDWISAIAGFVFGVVSAIGGFIVSVSARLGILTGQLNDMLETAKSIAIATGGGALAGSVIPGVGTVFGGIAGLAGGLLAAGTLGGDKSTGLQAALNAAAAQRAWEMAIDAVKAKFDASLDTGLGALLGTGKGFTPTTASKPQAPALNTLVTQTNAAIAAVRKEWEGLFTGIVSGFDRAISGLINRTMTWRQAMFTVLGSVWQEFVKIVEQMVVKWLVGEAMKTAASKAAVAAQTASLAAGEAAQTGILGAHLIKQILASAQGVFAGIFSFLSPFMGPAAAAPAVAGAGTVAAAAAAIPFEVGSWNIPKQMLGLLHPGEMVISEPFASAIRGGKATAIGGGGMGDVHIHLSAIDTRSGADFIRQQGGEIAKAVKSQMRLLNPALAGAR